MRGATDGLRKQARTERTEGRDADISQSHSMKDWRLLESETWICTNLHSALVYVMVFPQYAAPICSPPPVSLLSNRAVMDD